MRREVTAWGLADEKVDAGETLLRLLAQSSRRAALYADLLERQYEGTAAWLAEYSGTGIAALVGHKFDLDKDGNPVAVEEAVRGLVRLEGEERDRCARFAKLALDAGIAERQVRLAEQQGALIARALRTMLERSGVDEATRALVLAQAPRALREIGSGVA